MTLLVSPYISAAQKRIESWEKAKLPWDRRLYEPVPLPRRYVKPRISRGRIALIAFALAAIITAFMWGMGNVADFAP